MELKKYQQRAIDTLQNYNDEVVQHGAKYAFIGTTGKPYNFESFGEVPFVCVKIPTGGGKTLVGCHALSVIMNTALNYKMERGIVIWFVPSEAIKTQTLNKFKDRNDPHRQALDVAFDNNIRIFSNEEALYIRKEDVTANLCIIVSSLDAFRKEKKLQKKYKVYQENGALINHFENIQENDSLELDEEKTVINSLANVIRISNPLVVIDEGHKTTTQLSIDFIKDLNPAFIIEYTATPRGGSNILVDISASELKDEQMVKIPLVLESLSQWNNALAQGIEKRNELEKDAKKIKGEYIRPIALFQAQSQSKTSATVTVGQIKDYLLAAKIPADEIAIKTSERNDLIGVNLFSNKCKIRYIITVNALAEGWDCSFAYVLVSVANVGAKIAVEQIIGRIIRMPYAKRKENENLNRSYVFASAKNFNEAATQIISGLETNGYSRFDLLNASQKDQKYELQVSRAVKKDFYPPLMSLNGNQLSFEALIGSKFKLANEDAKFNFVINHDNDGRALIDIKDDKWIKGAQHTLRLTYKDKNFTKRELAMWLSKKARFTMIAHADKLMFIDKAIEHQLAKYSLSELSVNRYSLLDRLNAAINDILEAYAKNNFDQFLTKGEISTGAYDAFPETITVSEQVPQEFNKNYYKKVDKLNKEELAFVERLDLDGLPNIEFWVRNREKVDPFYIQGWKRNKFYPDFIAVTKKGAVIALEWKGEDRVSNEDTEYKDAIARIWEKLGVGKFHFFLVHNGNIEEVLNKLKGF